MLFFLLITILGFLPGKAWGKIAVSADSAVLIDAASGQVLYEKDANRPRPPASTTKILTALIAIETSDPGETVVIGHRPPRVGGSTLGLRYQQAYLIDDLIKAALVISANDASLAIGEHIGGDEETFLYMMNKKALTLGARNSFFRNTNGLPSHGHSSSAFDLAIIARYAMHQPMFAGIVGSEKISIKSGSTSIYNTNRLLRCFPGADGVKTGTTNAAGQCLVASATRNGRQLIAVVLHSSQRFVDAARLLDYGFNEWVESVNYQAGEVVAVLPVDNGYPKTVEVVLEERLGATVPRSSDVVQCEILLDQIMLEPLPAESRVGDALLIQGGIVIQRVGLITRQSSRGLNRWREKIF